MGHRSAQQNLVPQQVVQAGFLKEVTFQNGTYPTVSNTKYRLSYPKIMHYEPVSLLKNITFMSQKKPSDIRVSPHKNRYHRKGVSAKKK